jgi:hypothetical protein
LAVLSWRLQGFAFGTDNNVFHIPIALRWFDLPQFSDDAFIQSLRDYATPVYAMLGLIADDGNIAAVFFAAFLFTRALTIYALLLILRACGLRDAWLWAATATLVLVSTVYGETAIGRDELFVSIFTHTALAQAIALIGVACLVRGRLVRAAAAMGLAFDLNAMVGTWALVPAILVALALLAGEPRVRARQVGWAAAVFALVSFPILGWIAATQHFGGQDFDYRKFLIGYYPNHFFIGWARWPDRIAFASQLLSGLLAAALLPRNRRAALLAIVGFALVFSAGMAIGQLSHSRFLLNLHLLRVDGMAIWLAVALVIAAAFAALASGRAAGVVCGIAAVSGLIAGNWDLVLAALLLLGAIRVVGWRSGWSLQGGHWGGWTVAGMAAAAFVGTALVWGAYSQAPVAPSGQSVPSDQQLLGAWPAAPYWLQVTQWARSTTRPDAVFLVPPKLDFVAAAKRRSWVGWKEGAAVMWAPGFYRLWRMRSEEVAALHDVGSALRYACRHGIDYVVLDKRPGRALPSIGAIHTVFSNRWFAVVTPARCG